LARWRERCIDKAGRSLPIETVIDAAEGLGQRGTIARRPIRR